MFNSDSDGDFDIDDFHDKMIKQQHMDVNVGCKLLLSD